MKRVVLVLVVSAFLTAPALADFAFNWNGNTLNAVAEVDMDKALGYGSGGPWSVQLVSGHLNPSIYGGVTAPASNVFNTFCVESNIDFRPDNTYWASIDPVVYSGGVGGGAGGDPVSDVTEWIYDQYRAGNPLSWDVSQIGTAIWWAEEESKGAENAITAAALAHFGYGADPSTFGNAGHTWGLNLWTIEPTTGGLPIGIDRQSFLITVPVPAGVLLGLLGFAAAGLKLRKSV